MLLVPLTVLSLDTAPAAASKAGHQGHHSKTAKGGTSYPITNYVGFVGGKHGKANHKLSTVEIGWINQQGGSADVAPEATIAAQVAVRYLNEKAGGIDGHPVKLVTCFIPDTVSAATTCGQQMANDRGVIAIGTGQIGIGNAAMETALAGRKKPLVFNFAGSASDESYQPGFILFGSSQTTEAPFAKLAQGLHVKKVALLYREEPGVGLEIDNILEGFKVSHIKMTGIVQYDASATDLTSALSAAKYQQAGLIVWPEGSVSGCAAIDQAVTQLHVKVPIATAVPCNDPQVAASDGGKLPEGWYYLSATDLYSPKTAEGATFLKTMKSFGEQKYAGDAWDEDSFSQILTIAKWYTEVLKSGKALTPSNVAKVAHAFKGPLPWGAPHLVCGKYRAQHLGNLCTNESLFVRYEHGNFNTVLGGWQTPPAGWHPVP